MTKGATVATHSVIADGYLVVVGTNRVIEDGHRVGVGTQVAADVDIDGDGAMTVAGREGWGDIRLIDIHSVSATGGDAERGADGAALREIGVAELDVGERVGCGAAYLSRAKAGGLGAGGRHADDEQAHQHHNHLLYCSFGHQLQN